jgi:hypothetical protein
VEDVEKDEIVADQMEVEVEDVAATKMSENATTVIKLDIFLMTVRNPIDDKWQLHHLIRTKKKKRSRFASTLQILIQK